MKHPYEDIETFIKEKMPDVVWSPRDQYFIYLSPTERLNVSIERGTGENGKYFGYGMYRHDILADAGIYDADVDSDNLATTYFDKLFAHTSVRDMIAIRKHIDKYVSNWNIRRMAAGHKSYFEEAEYEAIGQNRAEAPGEV